MVVYAIYNHKNDKIYVGQTLDIEKRLNEHNKKKGRQFIKKYIPVDN